MFLTKDIVLKALHHCMIIGGDTDEHPLVIKSNYTDAEVYFTYDPTDNIIWGTFSGSDSVKDFVYDAKFHKDIIGFIDDKPIKVHCGFWQSMLSIFNEAYKALDAQIKQHPTAAIILTGHSLGDPTAKLFRYYLHIKRYSDLHCIIIGFGGPCIGNQIFVNTFMSISPHTFRFYNTRDGVVRVLENKFNYQHCGIPIALEDVHGPEGIPKNIAAAIVNHDTARDYLKPLQMIKEINTIDQVDLLKQPEANNQNNSLINKV